MHTIFETHTHYDDEQFDEDRDVLLSNMPAHGIEPLINVGSTFDGAKKSLELAHKYPYVYAAVGIHPSEIGDFGESVDVGAIEQPGTSPGGVTAEQSTTSSEIEPAELPESSANENEVLRWLRSAADDKKTVAVGEIGLDYYWEKDEAVRSHQRYWFARQIDLAAECALPVIIHSREACEDTLREMRRAASLGVRGVIHCFSYSREIAEEYTKLGYYIGIGGVVTFKNAKKLTEIVKTIPLERILLETDCPYLAPEPFRGKRNDSMLLPYVVQKIAKLREITEDEVIEVTHANARRLFLER